MPRADRLVSVKTPDFDDMAHQHVAAFLAGRAVDQALFDAVAWSVAARRGVYERDYGSFGLRRTKNTGYAYFDGATWGLRANTPGEAKKAASNSSVMACRWRGLAVKP